MRCRTVKGLSKQVTGGWRWEASASQEARDGAGQPGQRSVVLTWHPGAVVGHSEALQ